MDTLTEYRTSRDELQELLDALGSAVRDRLARPQYPACVYAERPVLSPIVACTWEQTTATGLEQRVVPDACVDLIWSGERPVNIAGPDTRARVVTLAPARGSSACGCARAWPGPFCGLPASELCDCTAEAADVLGSEAAAALLEALAAGADPHALLLRACRSGGAREPDPLVGAAVAALGRPRARVSRRSPRSWG